MALVTAAPRAASLDLLTVIISCERFASSGHCDQMPIGSSRSLV